MLPPTVAAWSSATRHSRPDQGALQAQSMLAPYLRPKTNTPCMNIPAGKSQSACMVEDTHARTHARTRSRTETPDIDGKVCCETALHSKDGRARRTMHISRTLAQGTRGQTDERWDCKPAALTALVSGAARHALVIQDEEAQRERHDSGAETGKMTQPRLRRCSRIASRRTEDGKRNVTLCRFRVGSVWLDCVLVAMLARYRR